MMTTERKEELRRIATKNKDEAVALMLMPDEVLELLGVEEPQSKGRTITFKMGENSSGATW